jgi:hypothetical protein
LVSELGPMKVQAGRSLGLAGNFPLRYECQQEEDGMNLSLFSLDELGMRDLKEIYISDPIEK